MPKRMTQDARPDRMQHSSWKGMFLDIPSSDGIDQWGRERKRNEDSLQLLNLGIWKSRSFFIDRADD
jgi:hypothetical protein